MVLLRVLPLAFFILCAAAANGSDLQDCGDRKNAEADACTKPIDDVVTYTPGVNYTAKIRCYDCPYTVWHWDRKNSDQVTGSLSGDVDMLLKVALSRDNRSVFLNDQPFFPHLKTIPTPPKIWTPRVQPSFSYTNLSSKLGCAESSCRSIGTSWSAKSECMDWCYTLRLDEVAIDYFYTTKGTEYKGEDTKAEAQYWEFTFDAIGESALYSDAQRWGFDNPLQKMLKVVVEGTDIGKGKGKGYKGKEDMQAASSLFGPFGEEEKVYDYFIREVSLVDRAYAFPPRESLSFRQRFSRFFGNNVWQEEDHRLVYIREEWGQYGKEGTLRNMFGNFIHWPEWSLVWLIVSSVTGSLSVLYGMYWLLFWVQAQRKLMKWDNMDDVWDNLRREREEEENRLLDASYRDESDDGESSRVPRYIDDADTMKPLPAKPLPDKPLPEVPLIDA